MSTEWASPNRSPAKSPDFKWVLAARAGYILAFEELVTRNESRICRLALNITQDEKEAEDVLQDGQSAEKEQRSKTMKGATATKQGEAGTPVKILSAQVLGDRVNEIHEMIARRAYERFEQRAGEHGQDIEDWVQAESELLHVCRHDLRESAEAIILHAELPGTFSADQLKVSVEPCCLIVSGERDVEVICGDDKPPHTERRPQRIFRVHNLPVEVDPSKATAFLQSKILEIVMPKVSAQKRPNDKAKEALSGG